MCKTRKKKNTALNACWLDASAEFSMTAYEEKDMYTHNVLFQSYIVVLREIFAYLVLLRQINHHMTMKTVVTKPYSKNTNNINEIDF